MKIYILPYLPRVFSHSLLDFNGHDNIGSVSLCLSVFIPCLSNRYVFFESIPSRMRFFIFTLSFSRTEFNEALGKMTHSGCEVSFNFLPQEFELPATLATIRRMVRLMNIILCIVKAHFYISSISVEDERDDYPVSILTSCLLYVHLCFGNWTLWWIFR